MPGAAGDMEGLGRLELDLRAGQLARFAPFVLGSPMALVAAVRANPCAMPGPDTGGRGFLDGPDGDALERTLGSLGYPEGSLMGIQLPGDFGDAGSAMSPADLRLVLETVDPMAVVAVDLAAAGAVAEAFGGAVNERPVLGGAPGQVSRSVMGRTLVVVDDLESSLSSLDGKRRAWAELRALSGPIGR